MTDLDKKLESLSEAVAKIGYISQSCNDAGLKLLLQDVEYELIQVHHFLDYHMEEGILQWSPGDSQ